MAIWAHLQSRNRTGANPYASTYTYNSRGLRATAFRSESGVTSHDAAYTYDNAGRLTQVSDSQANSGLGGTYAWNQDHTLSSITTSVNQRNLSYNEEGQLTSFNVNSILKEEYNYWLDTGEFNLNIR